MNDHKPDITTTATTNSTSSNNDGQNPRSKSDNIIIAIAGGGIVGLTLALCLNKNIIMNIGKDDNNNNNNDSHTNNTTNNNVQIIIYEQAEQFVDDIGAGMGLYPNGLRVLRDIEIIDQLRQVGYPYVTRSWTRHDGTEIATANEIKLLLNQQQQQQQNQNEQNSNNNNNNNNNNNHENNNVVDEELLKLQSLGIRRWRLQKVLYNAVQSLGTIPIHFGKRIVKVRIDTATGTNNTLNSNFSSSSSSPPRYELIMQDGSIAYADIVFAADGSKSCIREQVLQQKYDMISKLTNQSHAYHQESNSNNSNDGSVLSPLKQQLLASKHSNLTGLYNPKALMPQLKYCGVTCLMGIAEYHENNNTDICGEKNDTTCIRRKGICCPSSDTTGCHGVFFPTGPNEECFQFHFPVHKSKADPTTWGILTQNVLKEECKELAVQLRADGWDETYIKPLEHATNVVRIGFCLLEPETLNQFVYCIHPEADNTEENNEQGPIHPTATPRRIVLLGDAAHPPVPYIGQGAQMGLEDAGTLSLLLQHYCLDENEKFSLKNFHQAMDLYEKIRIPRTREMLDHGKASGKKQEIRANRRLRAAGEELTRRDVFFHETAPDLFPGAQYDYKAAVQEAIQHEQQQQTLRNNHHSPKHRKHHAVANHVVLGQSNFPCLVEDD